MPDFYFHGTLAQYWKAIHAADERVPVDALEFGVQAIFKALQRFR